MKTLFEIGSEILEEQFPKGECTERGHAIVLLAEILIKGRDEAQKILPKKKVEMLFGLQYTSLTAILPKEKKK